MKDAQAVAVGGGWGKAERGVGFIRISEPDNFCDE